VRVMELNARTTMSHYALAAKRRLEDPSSVSPSRIRRFAVVRLSELAELRGGGETVVCLTDPETAHSFVAVVVLETEASISLAELH